MFRCSLLSSAGQEGDKLEFSNSQSIALTDEKSLIAARSIIQVYSK